MQPPLPASAADALCGPRGVLLEQALTRRMTHTTRRFRMTWLSEKCRFAVGHPAGPRAESLEKTVTTTSVKKSWRFRVEK
jgi:hypothetical protein